MSARASWGCVLWLCIAGCERKASSVAESLPPRPASDTVATSTLEQRASSEPARDPPAQRAGASLPKVVFLGDSISAGLHLPAEQAFPAVLQSKLAAKGLPFQLSNAGVSGDTSAGGLRRCAWILKQKPAIVAIELGANDGLRGLPVATIEQNLRAIVAQVQAHGARPLLLGMRVPPSYGAEYSESFAALYPRLAEELQIPFVPYFMASVAGVPERNLPDGLHPTREGHERLADNTASQLERLLRELRDAPKE